MKNEDYSGRINMGKGRAGKKPLLGDLKKDEDERNRKQLLPPPQPPYKVGIVLLRRLSSYIGHAAPNSLAARANFSAFRCFISKKWRGGGARVPTRPPFFLSFCFCGGGLWKRCQKSPPFQVLSRGGGCPCLSAQPRATASSPLPFALLDCFAPLRCRERASASRDPPTPFETSPGGLSRLDPTQSDPQTTPNDTGRNPFSKGDKGGHQQDLSSIPRVKRVWLSPLPSELPARFIIIIIIVRRRLLVSSHGNLLGSLSLSLSTPDAACFNTEARGNARVPWAGARKTGSLFIRFSPFPAINKINQEGDKREKRGKRKKGARGDGGQ